MRQETSRRASGGRGFLVLAVAVAVGAVAVTRAEPARANNDFQNGFEDQLGRIAAYQVAALGVRVLSGAYPPVVVAPVVVPVVVGVPYYAPPVVYVPSYGGYYYGHPHKLKVRQVVYYPGRPCNAGYDRAPGYSRGGKHPHSHGYRDERGDD
jgi:hypothetical protein